MSLNHFRSVFDTIVRLLCPLCQLRLLINTGRRSSEANPRCVFSPVSALFCNGLFHFFHTCFFAMGFRGCLVVPFFQKQWGQVPFCSIVFFVNRPARLLAPFFFARFLGVSTPAPRVIFFPFRPWGTVNWPTSFFLLAFSRCRFRRRLSGSFAVS